MALIYEEMVIFAVMDITHCPNMPRLRAQAWT